jgi:hypothetical protein
MSSDKVPEIPEQIDDDNDIGLPSGVKGEVITGPHEHVPEDDDILNGLQVLRDQQKAELDADRQAIDNRPAPAYYGADQRKPEPPLVPHLVPATVIENLNTMIDERKAAELAKGKSIETLPDKNLQGVAYEGMVQRALEDKYGEDHVIVHPKDMTLKDGRHIEPDFVTTNDQGEPTEIVDAKGYMRKDTHNPEAAASSLTHMANLEKASRYTAVDEETVKKVSFYIPTETAGMKSVQGAASALGTDDRPLSVEGVGTEADLKQRVADLRIDPSKRFEVSDDVISEIERIQNLPIGERRTAMGDFMSSLQDDKGDETTVGRNLRWRTRVERNGDGVTIIGKDGKEYSVWYK